MTGPVGPYRRLVAAVAFFVVTHVLALVTMGTILLQAIGPSEIDAARDSARWVAEHPWLWRLGWVPWQLSALSDLLVCLALIDWARHQSSAAKRWAWASLVFDTIGAIPEQLAEWEGQTTLVDVATLVTSGQGNVVAYQDLFGELMQFTGTYANTAYVAMTVAWMMAARAAARDDERRAAAAWPGWLEVMLVTIFLAAGTANWLGQERGMDGAVTWFWIATALNGVAFPALVVWSLYWIGQLGERQRGRPAVRVPWPEGGRLRWLAPLAMWSGVRDALRPFSRLLPFPVLRSDVVHVVYLSWWVPTERVRHLVPGLELDERDGETVVSILTYRHGHFGPRVLGPLRKWLPSPIQSNWRLYLAPASAQAEGIAFFENGLDHSLYAIGSRLLSDGLPGDLVHAEHRRDGDVVTTRLDPAGGAGPDLHARVRVDPNAPLPASFAAHFDSWGAAVDYLVRQNRGERIHPQVGLRSVSRIDIPIDVATVERAQVEHVESERLRAVVEGCEPFAFVVPAVRFSALGEDWVRLR